MLPLKVLARDNAAVSSTAVGLTIPASITTKLILTRVQAQGQGQALRVTYDGTAPVPASNIGEILWNGDVVELMGVDIASKFLAIRETANDARMEYTFLGTG